MTSACLVLGVEDADPVRLWRTIILPPLAPTFESMGSVAGVDVGSTLEITLEIVITWMLLAAFFWAFLALVSLVAAKPGEPRVSGKRRHQYATLLGPTLIPIALGYLFAHNLTELLVVGPLMVTARDASPAQISGLVQQQINAISPTWVWWVQAGAIVLGHVVAVIMAHAALSRRPQPASSVATPPVQQRTEPHNVVLRTDLAWLGAMLTYTATSLWILAQPIIASR